MVGGMYLARADGISAALLAMRSSAPRSSPEALRR